MDSFSSPSMSSGSPPNPEAVMEEIKAQLAQSYAQELLETVGNKCFAKCVTKPGSSMSEARAAVSRCVDRYIEATGIDRALFSHRTARNALHRNNCSPLWKRYWHRRRGAAAVEVGRGVGASGRGVAPEESEEVPHW
ncbi:hypothetical protein ZWY2020_019705 [Hordeum vulgare]|nr:hypothetical protein ZWY2020_019705 [Hordeum vulgare]